MAEIPAQVLAQAAAHAEACWPRESCGVILRAADGTLCYRPMRNAATAPGAYAFEAAEQLAVWRSGWVAAIVHSHPDAPAAFSAADRREAEGPDGSPLFPCVDYLVLSVAGPHPRAVEARAFSWQGRSWTERAIELPSSCRGASCVGSGNPL